MKYYKFLDENNHGPYSGFDFSEYLPTDDGPGPWLPEVENLVDCESGYHGCTRDQLRDWLHSQLYEIEYKHPPEETDDKVNGHCIRFVRRVDTWNERTARLFVVWCTREALKLIDDPDPRSIKACDVAERYANGESTAEELAAAWAAARGAAWVAAWAAWVAAWAAARDAARSAARVAAAWEEVSAAQSRKLIEMLELEL